MEKLKRHKCFEGETAFWQHDSITTKTKMKFSTFIPQGKVEGCLIWLSGLTCTEENFITKSGVQKYLAENNLMVIAPDTSPRGLNLPQEHESYDFGSGASFYLNATSSGYKEHYKMEDYIIVELYELIQSSFGVKNISLFGHSMGGHGALVLGLKYAEKFKSISAFSPITNPSQTPWGQKAFKGYFGENQKDWESHDATLLIQNNLRHPNPILIHQGSQDEFLDRELKYSSFIMICSKEGQALSAHLSEGYDHSYYFISTFIKMHIEHHAKYIA